MVAAIKDGHPHQGRAASEVNRRFASGETLVLAAHALSEAYAILTGTYRVPPRVARRALDGSFVGLADQIVALDAGSYRGVLEGAPDRGIVGGRIYDALIAECARLAGVETLLTFNDRHFESLVSPPTQVVVPA